MIYHIKSICYEIRNDGTFERGWTKRYSVLTTDIEAVRAEKMIKHHATKVHLTYEEITE